MGNYTSVVLGDKPIRYYRLSETSGTTALDQSTNLSNGTLHGGVTLNQTGLLTADTDPCMLFNGTSGYIELPTSGLPTGAHAFSIECWTKISSAPAGTFPTLMMLGLNLSLQQVALYYVSDSACFQLWYGTALNSLTSLPLNTVYHVVVTYNGSTLSLYINGMLHASVGSITLNMAYGVARIGEDTSGDFFTSYLDEVAIYSSALSATQINHHYLAGIGALDFPVVPLTTATRDGHMTATTRDGLGLSTKTRG